jgi:hypothetical protein
LTAQRVTAAGGTRTVPAPDPVARDYLLLALRLDQLVPGIVHGYFGPADLKARVDMEQLHGPARLADDAVALRARLGAEVAEADRRHWLDLQLLALEAIARAEAATRAGARVPYLEHVTRCFALRPVRRPDSRFVAAAADLDRCLPGSGSLHDRLATEDARWTIDPQRLPAVVDRLVSLDRERATALFGLPDREDLLVSLVRGQPWAGYNWYDGGFHSRVDLNLDLPIQLPALVDTVAHETYPGHHLEHARKEQVLVERSGRLEASVLLINTPECLISEGLATIGPDMVVPPGERADLLADLAPLAGLPLAADPVQLREAAERAGRIVDLRSILGEARVNAALMLHEDGLAREEVRAYLVEVGRNAPDVAAKRLEFLEHPLWRTYVFVYPEGEALLRRWLDVVPEADRPARFGRLLQEPLTPPAIEREIAAIGGAVAGAGPGA